MSMRLSVATALLFAAIAIGLAAPGARASAQTAPAPAATATPRPSAIPTLPPNTSSLIKDAIDALAGAAKAPMGWDADHTVGQVTYFKGYELQVRLPLEKFREIHLHRGTVINPRGATIRVGNTVDVRGRGQSDGSLNADTIFVH